MVLAAGLGKRMRPITDTMPKPLVKIAGKTLLDWGLDSLAAAGVEKAVVNVHYLPEQIVAHVAARASAEGRHLRRERRPARFGRRHRQGAARAGQRAFYILNADTFWIDSGAAQPRPPRPCMGQARKWIFC